jgi:dolichyl-phosphate beta-glucosyltransferase
MFNILMVSIVIPCFNIDSNFSAKLDTLICFLQNEYGVFEIIVVDDSCPDKFQLNLAANKQNVFIVLHKENKGKGAAVQSGINRASGNIVLFTDADFPYSNDNIKTAIEEIHKGAELVIGDRTISGSDFYSKMPLYRNTGSALFTMFVKLFALRGFGDTQCGLKAFSSNAAQMLFSKLKTKGFAFDVEILRKAKQNKMIIKKIPVHFARKQASSITLTKALQTFFDVLKISFQNKTP